jgi:hypothetical protein
MRAYFKTFSITVFILAIVCHIVLSIDGNYEIFHGVTDIIVAVIGAFGLASSITLFCGKWENA